MGLLSFLGLGGSTPQVPGLEDYVGNLSQATTPAYQNLLAQLGGQANMPDLPPEMYAQLQALYGGQMQQGMRMLDSSYQDQIGGNAAKAARLGQVGSTGHARMVGNTNTGYANQAAGLHQQSSNDMFNTIFNLRNALLGANTQRLGFASQAIPGMMGINMQGFGAMQQGQQINQASQQSLINSLMGIGSAIPGLAGGLYGLLSGGGGTNGLTPYTGNATATGGWE